MLTGIPYIYFNGFVNCYIGCNNDYSDDEKRRIYVAFKRENLEEEFYESKSKGKVENLERVEVLRGSELYEREIEVNDYILFIFRPSKEFEKDFDTFISGKYSEFSSKYKRLLKSIYPSIKKLKSIIEPTDADRKKLAKELACCEDLLKNSEIYDTPNEIEETFSLAHFLEVEL
jgi:hypothetical protein